MSKIFVTVLSLLLLLAFLAGLILSGIITIYEINIGGTAFGNMAMWVSAVGTAGTLIFLSRQHVKNVEERKKDKQKEKKYKESKIALDLYLSTIDTLLALINNEDVDRSRALAFFPTSCETLKKLAPKITEDTHLSSAEVKHHELKINLQILYFSLKAGDIFHTLGEKHKDISLSNHSDSFNSSVFFIVIIWMRYVLPNCEPTTSMYGYGEGFLADKYLYSLMALLVSTPKSEMLSHVDIENQFRAFNLGSDKNEKHLITVDNEWLMDLEEKYPLLFAYFALKNSGFKVEKQAIINFKEKSKYIYYPQFTIHGHVPQDGLDNVWFILNRPTMTAYLSIPERLSQTKEKFIVRLNTKKD